MERFGKLLQECLDRGFGNPTGCSWTKKEFARDVLEAPDMFYRYINAPSEPLPQPATMAEIRARFLPEGADSDPEAVAAVDELTKAWRLQRCERAGRRQVETAPVTGLDTDQTPGAEPRHPPVDDPAPGPVETGSSEPGAELTGQDFTDAHLSRNPSRWRAGLGNSYANFALYSVALVGVIKIVEVTMSLREGRQVAASSSNGGSNDGVAQYAGGVGSFANAQISEAECSALNASALDLTDPFRMANEQKLAEGSPQLVAGSDQYFKEGGKLYVKVPVDGCAAPEEYVEPDQQNVQPIAPSGGSTNYRMAEYGQTGSTALTQNHVGDAAAAKQAMIGDAPSGPDIRISDGAQEETVAPSPAKNVIRGSDGVDVLVGTDGDDILSSGANFDRITGGAGRDTFLVEVGTGRDTITDFTKGEDKIDLSQTFITSLADLVLIDFGYGAGVTLVTGDQQTSLRLLGHDVDSLDADDFVFATKRSAGDLAPPIIRPNTDVEIQLTDDWVVVEGTSGDDVVVGGDFATEMFGYEGRDVFHGQKLDDKIHGNSGRDKLTGNAGDDHLFGGGGEDRHFGGTGRDVINGGFGHDRLKGGKGADTLTGGAGKDVFLFDRHDKDDRTDLIVDFNTSEDRICIFMDGFDADAEMIFQETDDGLRLSFDGIDIFLARLTDEAISDIAISYNFDWAPI